MKNNKEKQGVKLQRMARITLQQAIQTAESSANTQAYNAELEREDEGLVYGVGIANQDMYIDAGNGWVPYTKTEGRGEDDSSRPRSRV